MVKVENNYISVLRYGWLTKFYDPIMAGILREKKFKHQLIQQAIIQSGHRVLDLGCGTATLTILLKQLYPDTEVVGLDGDDKVLAIAQRKIAAAGLEIEFKEGMSFELDFPDQSFDRVLSSLLFHHLTTKRKHETLAEIKRVLKPGGGLHIADWGKPQNFLMRGAFLIVQLLDGFTTTSESIQGKLHDYIKQAGFNNADETQRFETIFGTLSLYRATLS